VVPGQSADFSHQYTFAHFLESQGGGNVIQIGFFSGNQMTVNLPPLVESGNQHNPPV
jgi:hypothetical protein